MSESYLTVKNTAEVEYIERRSRFIAHIKPVEHECEALEFLALVRAKHGTASHNVYAYAVRENNTQRYSDDGEPSGTAAIPILEVIKKEGLTDIIIVVTRYFGGVLLGAGGLVRAYGKSAKLGIDKAGIVEMLFCNIYSIRFDYALLGKLRHELRDYIIEDILYEDCITMTVCVRLSEDKRFLECLTQAVNGAVQPEVVGERYAVVDQQ